METPPPSRRRLGPLLVRLREYLGALGEIWRFLRVRKKWWLAPVFLVLGLLGLVLVLSQGSALSPFIYTVF